MQRKRAQVSAGCKAAFATPTTHPKYHRTRRQS
jgi:hypothetical protein